jgi:hypothetical protein
LIADPRASRALVSALAFAGALACTSCARDFDGLFTNADGGSSGAGSSGSSGASGTSGSACACPPCKGKSCSFACPAGCPACTCDRFVCGDEESCTVDCAAGVACDVVCGDQSNCIVTCAKNARCSCTGNGCNVACPDGDKRSCAGKSVVCNRDCP